MDEMESLLWNIRSGDFYECKIKELGKTEKKSPSGDFFC